MHSDVCVPNSILRGKKGGNNRTELETSLASLAAGKSLRSTGEKIIGLASLAAPPPLASLRGLLFFAHLICSVTHWSLIL